MFSKHLVPVSLVLCSALLANCGRAPKKPDLKPKENKTEEANPIAKASELVGTWISCVDITPEAQGTVTVKSYPVAQGATFTFDAEGNGSLHIASYADADCSKELSDEDVAKVLDEVKSLRTQTGTPALSVDQEAEFDDMKATHETFSYVATDANEENIGQLDRTAEGVTTFQSWTLVKGKLDLSKEEKNAESRSTDFDGELFSRK